MLSTTQSRGSSDQVIKQFKLEDLSIYAASVRLSNYIQTTSMLAGPYTNASLVTYMKENNNVSLANFKKPQ